MAGVGQGPRRTEVGSLTHHEMPSLCSQPRSVLLGGLPLWPSCPPSCSHHLGLPPPRPPSLVQGLPLPFATSPPGLVQPGVTQPPPRLQTRVPNLNATPHGCPLGTPAAYTGVELRPSPCPQPLPQPSPPTWGPPACPASSLCPAESPEPEALGEAPSQAGPRPWDRALRVRPPKCRRYP